MSKQTFKVHKVSVNGQSLGGVGSVTPNIQSVEVASDSNGAFGQEHVVSIFNRLLCNISTFDVDKIGAVLAATPGNVIAMSQNAGLTTDNILTMGGSLGAYLITGATARFPVGGIASMDLSGEFRWGAGDAIEDMMVYTTAAGVATNVPDRYIKPGAVAFAGQTILHVQEISFSAQANTTFDMADVDNGPEALDIIGWNAPRVSITFKDASLAVAVHMQQTLVALGEGELTATLIGMGATSDATLTITNIRFLQGGMTFNEQYGTFTVEGSIPILSDAGTVSHDWNTTAVPGTNENFIVIA